MRISLDITKQHTLSMDEDLNIIIQSILNKFDIATCYYTEQIKRYPELEGLIKVEGE